MFKALRTLGIAALALCFLGTPASAGFIGKTVGIFDRVDDPFGFPPGISDNLITTTVVGAQTEYDSFFDFIDIADTTITIGNNNRKCVNGFCPITFLGLGDFHGFKIADTADELEEILSVSVLSSTDPSFTDADITFTGDEIFISIEDFGNYAVGNVIPQGEIVLQVTFAQQIAQVSAPGSSLGLLAGILIIGAARYRQGQ